MPLLLLFAAGVAVLWLHKKSSGFVPPPGDGTTGGLVSNRFIPAGTSVGFGAGGKEFAADGAGGIYRMLDGAVPTEPKLLTYSGHVYLWTLGANGVWDSKIQPDANPDGSYSVVVTQATPGGGSTGRVVMPDAQLGPLASTASSGFGTATLTPSGAVTADSSGMTTEGRLGLLGLPAGGLVFTDGSKATASVRTVPTTTSSPILVNGTRF